MAKVQAQAETDSEARDLARQVRIETAGGTIRATGPATRRGAWWSVSFDILLPRNSDLETETVNGPMSVDYPITLQGHIDFHRITTRIGAGGPPVRAVTTNGPVTVRRR